MIHWEKLVAWLGQFFRSRYVMSLEEEVERLRAEIELVRAENRALVNSLLGTAGIPPIELPEAAKKVPPACGGPRVRRRSWHQIQAWHEREEAQRAEAAGKAAERMRTNGQSFDN